MKTKVSIIIPVYNVEKYLNECINSAINQTLKGIEIIAINDGSTDDSLEILMKYKKKYDFVKVINQQNKGVSEARNIGVEEAKGEYIYFLDSDDYIDIDSMEYTYNLAKKHDLDIVTFDAKVFFDNCSNQNVKNSYDRHKLLESKVMSGEEFYCYAWKNRGYRIPIGLNLYRREFLKNMNIKFYKGIIHEDELYSTYAFILSKKIMYTPHSFFNRRIRENSIMTTEIGVKNIVGITVVADQMYKFYLKNNIDLKSETNERLLKNIGELYSKVIMYHDKLYGKHKKEDRDMLISKIKNTEIPMNKKLALQLKNPKLYYGVSNMESKLKSIIKSIYFR